MTEQQGVEAEAMSPADLRAIVADAFEPLVDRQSLDRLRIMEAAERHGQRPGPGCQINFVAVEVENGCTAASTPGVWK